MAECINYSKCPFVKNCEELDKMIVAKGFINMYCKGDKMDSCIRLRLCNTYSKEIVPKNMMPNGMPLSGTTNKGWDEKAVKFRKYL